MLELYHYWDSVCSFKVRLARAAPLEGRRMCGPLDTA